MLGQSDQVVVAGYRFDIFSHLIYFQRDAISSPRYNHSIIMTDSTQLADQFLLQSSLKTDASVKVSRGKSVAVVNDGQSGSYSSGIVSFDCQSALNGSTGYASLKDAYVVLPFVVSMKNTHDTLAAAAYPARYALGMKCNVANVIDEVKVYLNGKSIITPSEYKQIWSNVRAMAELTTAEVEKHGADMFLYPDDWESTKHSATATDMGDGYCNNMLSGASALTLAGATDATRREPGRSNSGFIRRVLNNPPEVAGAAASHGWPSLGSATSQAVAQMRGTGAFKKGTTLIAGSTLGEWFYMLKIRLVDLHPIFSEIDLVGNPQLKLELKVQTGYSDLTLTPNTDLAVRSMKLDSTTLVAGSVCPVMIGSSFVVNDKTGIRCMMLLEHLVAPSSVSLGARFITRSRPSPRLAATSHSLRLASTFRSTTLLTPRRL